MDDLIARYTFEVRGDAAKLDTADEDAIQEAANAGEAAMKAKLPDGYALKVEDS